MHPLDGAAPVPYVPVRVTRGALVVHLYDQVPVPDEDQSAYAPPRCRTLLYRRTFIPFSMTLWNDLAVPVFDGV